MTSHLQAAQAAFVAAGLTARVHALAVPRRGPCASPIEGEHYYARRRRNRQGA